MTDSEAMAKARDQDGKKASYKNDPLAAPKRRRPKQDRSKITVDQILHAAVGILEAGGFEAVTMQAIADTAEINVATVYSYFPNKHHVLAHIARLRLNERLDLLEGLFSRIAERDDWINGFVEALEALYRLRGEQAGMVALRQAMHASPPLWEIDQEGNQKAGQLVAKLLASKLAGSAASLHETQGRLIAEYVTATFDHLQRLNADMQKQAFDEIVRLTRSYLTALESGGSVR